MWVVAKKVRNLRLLSSEQAVENKDCKENFALVASSDLAVAEQRLVEQLVSSAAPGSGIIAVVRTQHSWDLRPVVMKVGEAHPSIIRVSGPLGQSAANANNDSILRLQSVFERSNHAFDDPDALCDWGQHEGRVWYRRTLHHATLSQQLQTAELNAQDICTFTRRLIEQVISLHAYGVVHGHISTSNIVLNSEGRPLLLDTGVAHAQLQEGMHRDLSLAPELRTIAATSTSSLTTSSLLPSADVFGIGQVCQLLVIKAQREAFESGDEANLLLDALAQRLEPALAYAETSRPALHDLLSAIRELDSAKSSQRLSSASLKQRKLEPRASSNERSKYSTHDNQQHLYEHANAQVESVRLEGNVQQKVFLAAQENLAAQLLASELQAPQLQAPELLAQQVPQDQIPVSQALTPNTDDTPKSMWWVYLIGLVSIAFCVWTVYPNLMEQDDIEYSAAELRVAWSSGLPSKMKPVVELATQYPQSFAEQLVVRSALQGEKLPVGINSNLIRIAFDNRWEMSLRDSDRSTALLLGTAGFVSHTDSSAIGDLSTLHPGVVFAITASAPEAARSSLSRFKAEKLTKLPGRIGAAFGRVLQGKEDANCSEQGIPALAEFAAFGISRPAEVFLFLQEDFNARLQALAILFGNDELVAKSIIETVLHYPNGSFSNPEVSWANNWNLESWQGVSSGQLLQLISGMAPTDSLDASYVAVLFAHPATEVRKYAVTEARDRIAFVHPASLEVLSMLVEKPDTLSAEQLFQLAKILENPSKVTPGEIQKWMKSNPDKKVLKAMLFATAAGKSATHVDTFVAMELNSQNWKLSIDEAKALSTHPDDYTRMMSYQQLFTMGSEASFVLLQESMRNEQNQAYRKQLGEMLEMLHASLNS